MVMLRYHPSEWVPLIVWPPIVAFMGFRHHILSPTEATLVKTGDGFEIMRKPPVEKEAYLYLVTQTQEDGSVIDDVTLYTRNRGERFVDMTSGNRLIRTKMGGDGVTTWDEKPDPTDTQGFDSCRVPISSKQRFVLTRTLQNFQRKESKERDNVTADMQDKYAYNVYSLALPSSTYHGLKAALKQNALDNLSTDKFFQDQTDDSKSCCFTGLLSLGLAMLNSYYIVSFALKQKPIALSLGSVIVHVISSFEVPMVVYAFLMFFFATIEVISAKEYRGEKLLRAVRGQKRSPQQQRQPLMGEPLRSKQEQEAYKIWLLQMYASIRLMADVSMLRQIYLLRPVVVFSLFKKCCCGIMAGTKDAKSSFELFERLVWGSVGCFALYYKVHSLHLDFEHGPVAVLTSLSSFCAFANQIMGIFPLEKTRMRAKLEIFAIEEAEVLDMFSKQIVEKFPKSPLLACACLLKFDSLLLQQLVTGNIPEDRSVWMFGAPDVVSTEIVRASFFIQIVFRSVFGESKQDVVRSVFESVAAQATRPFMLCCSTSSSVVVEFTGASHDMDSVEKLFVQGERNPAGYCMTAMTRIETNSEVLFRKWCFARYLLKKETETGEPPKSEIVQSVKDIVDKLRESGWQDSADALAQQLPESAENPASSLASAERFRQEQSSPQHLIEGKTKLAEAELKKKKAEVARKRAADERIKKAEAAKKARLDAAKKKTDEKAEEKTEEAPEEAAEEKPAEEEDIKMEPVELTEEESKLWYRPKTGSELPEQSLAKVFTSFSLPEKAEGFDDITFPWQPASTSQKHLTDYILQRKLTCRVEDLHPGEWFKEQSKKFQAWLATLKKRQNDWKNPAQKKAIIAKIIADKKKAEKTEDGEEKKEEGEKKEEEPAVELPKIDADDLNPLEVEDVMDIGSGEPLFANFAYEDWELLILRAELLLLVHAFKKDMDDPERTGFHKSHAAFYYNKYFKKQLVEKQYGQNSMADLISLVKDAIVLNSQDVLEAILPEDAPNDGLVKLTEEHRRDRQRRVDAGDETAELKFKKQQPQQQGSWKQQPQQPQQPSWAPAKRPHVGGIPPAKYPRTGYQPIRR